MPKTPKSNKTREYIELSKEECMKSIVRYQAPNKRHLNGMIEIGRVLVGVLSKEKPGYIHEVTGCGRMSKQLTKIPVNYKRKSNKFFKNKLKGSMYCNVIPRQKAENAKKKGVDMETWMRKSSRKYHLTINQVKRMKKGQKLKVLCLDRNIYDHVDSEPTYKVTSPSTFFRGCWAIYTHDHDMTGFLRFSWEGGKGKGMEFTFHLNYRNDSWYPLTEKGDLPAWGDMGIMLGIKKHYTKFPGKTRIGFRGPMIPWSDLKRLPKIYKCIFC
jgi:hypothetical protein